MFCKDSHFSSEYNYWPNLIVHVHSFKVQILMNHLHLNLRRFQDELAELKSGDAREYSSPAPLLTKTENVIFDQPPINQSKTNRYQVHTKTLYLRQMHGSDFIWLQK